MSCLIKSSIQDKLNSLGMTGNDILVFLKVDDPRKDSILTKYRAFQKLQGHLNKNKVDVINDSDLVIIYKSSGKFYKTIDL